MEPFETLEPEPAPRRSGSTWVVWAGLATTALTLLGVYLSSELTGFNLMGWYVDYLIPVGALVVGAVAASGYGMASWWTGTKITRLLLWVVLGLQLWAYFAAQYIEFRSLPLFHRVSFFTYFDLTTRLIAWNQPNGGVGQPLGAWGYGIRLLEIAGFVGGGLLVPLALLGRPYCEACRRYKRSKPLGLLPAGVVPQKIKTKDLEGLAAYQRSLAEAQARGLEMLEAVRARATAGKTEELQGLLAMHQGHQKAYNKLTQRILLTLVSCPGCRAGTLEATALSGFGKEIKQVVLGRWALDPGVVRAVLDE